MISAVRKSTVAQITILYDHGEQKSISKCTACQNFADWSQQQKTTLAQGQKLGSKATLGTGSGNLDS